MAQSWRSTNGQPGVKHLLQVAATGSGKSLLIAMAPFAGARKRNLVVVPNLKILESLAKGLGGEVFHTWESNLNKWKAAVADIEEKVPPVLRKLGLLAQGASMPRVLVLNDLPKKRRDGKYVYPPKTDPRLLCEIILDYEVVLSSAQTLVASKKKKMATKKRKLVGDADDDDDDDDDDVVEPGQIAQKLMEMHKWIVEHEVRIGPQRSCPQRSSPYSPCMMTCSACRCRSSICSPSTRRTTSRQRRGRLSATSSALSC